jgi:hypothetical protein
MSAAIEFIVHFVMGDGGCGRFGGRARSMKRLDARSLSGIDFECSPRI